MDKLGLMVVGRRKVICALDTGNLSEARKLVRRLAPWVGAFKIGHALVLPNGLDVVDRLRDEGADRIFLDLKFHDIPNSVALGVESAARKGVWMTTLHISGGPAMMTAAVEASRSYGEENAPLLVGVSVLTSIEQETLSHYLGVPRTILEHMTLLSREAIEFGLDGVVCGVSEVKVLRNVVGHGIIVTPGIRSSAGERHDQRRVGEPNQALEAGADYLVVGRALTASEDPVQALVQLGLSE